MFQKCVPRIKRFLERKFELDIREQDSIFTEKEAEVAELENEKERVQARYNLLRCFIDKISHRCESLADEAQRDYISRSFLREERKLLDDLLEEAEERDYHTFANRLQTGLARIIDYLELSSATKVQQKSLDEPTNGYRSRFGSDKVPITVRVNQLCENIHEYIEEISPKDLVGTDSVRSHLDHVLCRLNVIKEEMYYIRRVFISTHKKNEELKDETLSLIKNYQEIQRLERDLAEKRRHVSELRQQGTMMRKKSKKHERQLEQIKKGIDDQKELITKVERAMTRQVASADERVRFILQILPDEDGMSDMPFDRSTPFSQTSPNMDTSTWEGLDSEETFLTSRAPTRNAATPRPMVQESSASRVNTSTNRQRKPSDPPAANIMRQATSSTSQNVPQAIVTFPAPKPSGQATTTPRKRSDSNTEISRPRNAPLDRRTSLPAASAGALCDLRELTTPPIEPAKQPNDSKPNNTKPNMSEPKENKVPKMANGPRDSSTPRTPRTSQRFPKNINSPSRIPRSSSEGQGQRKVNGGATNNGATEPAKPPSVLKMSSKNGYHQDKPPNTKNGYQQEKSHNTKNGYHQDKPNGTKNGYHQDKAHRTNGGKSNTARPPGNGSSKASVSSSHKDQSVDGEPADIDALHIFMDSVNGTAETCSDKSDNGSDARVRLKVVVNGKGDDTHSSKSGKHDSKHSNKSAGQSNDSHKSSSRSLKQNGSKSPSRHQTPLGPIRNGRGSPEEIAKRPDSLDFRKCLDSRESSVVRGVTTPRNDQLPSSSAGSLRGGLDLTSEDSPLSTIKFVKPPVQASINGSAGPPRTARLTSMPGDSDRPSAPRKQVLTAKKVKLGW